MKETDDDPDNPRSAGWIEAHHDRKSSTESPQRASMPGRQPPTPEEWEQQKSNIARLYIDQEMPLRDVMAVMEGGHGFRASARMYKSRLGAWGFFKNISSEVMEDLIRNARVHGAPLELNGREVRTKVQRYLKRSGRTLTDVGLDQTVDRITPILTSRTISEGDLPTGRLNRNVLFNSGNSPMPMSGSSTRAGSLVPEVGTTTLSASQRSNALRPGLPSESELAHSPVRASATPSSGSPTPRPDVVSPRSATLSAEEQTLKIQHTDQMRVDILKQALLLAVLVTAVRPFSSIGDFDAWVNSANKVGFSSNFLAMSVDLLGFLQLNQNVCFLGVIYLFTYWAQHEFGKDTHVWIQIVVAFKFAKGSLELDMASSALWMNALSGLVELPINLKQTEAEFSKMPNVWPPVSENDKDGIKQLDEVSSKLLFWFDSGKLISISHSYYLHHELETREEEIRKLQQENQLLSENYGRSQIRCSTLERTCDTSTMDIMSLKHENEDLKGQLSALRSYIDRPRATDAQN
jgi:hypothetical protein